VTSRGDADDPREPDAVGLLRARVAELEAEVARWKENLVAAEHDRDKLKRWFTDSEAEVAALREALTTCANVLLEASEGWSSDNAYERAARVALATAEDEVSATVRPLSSGIWLELAVERHRQDARWGGRPGVDRIGEHTYAAVLGEEFGEVCREWLERDVVNLRAELIQVAAVAIAWIEEIDLDGRVRAATAAEEGDGA
jgi:NTP pyrophosphatase (non-canonical NTP hydrolase)